MLRAFHDRYPGIQLLIEEGGSQTWSGSWRAAPSTSPSSCCPAHPSPALTTVELLREDLVVVSSPDAPRPGGGRRTVRIADLESERLVMFRHGYDLRELTVAACRAEGLSRISRGGRRDGRGARLRTGGTGRRRRPAHDATRSGRGLRVTPLARPGLYRTIALAHRSDVAPPRAARELQRMLLER